MTECTFAPERAHIRGRKLVHVSMVAGGVRSRTNFNQKHCISIGIEAQVMLVLMNIVASCVTFSTHWSGTHSLNCISVVWWCFPAQVVVSQVIWLLTESQPGILFCSDYVTDYVTAPANLLLPWPLNWNGPFSCFGSFRDHSLPGPLTLHPPVLNTDHRIWPFGYRWGWLSAFLILLAVCPSSVFHFPPLCHSFPTLNIILKLFGSSTVYFGL